MNEVESKWQSVLRTIFPTIVVRQDFSIPEDDDIPFLGIYMIPDERMMEFTEKVRGKRFELMERENLPDVSLLHCSTSDTQRYYPHIYAEAQSEIRRSGRATKSASGKTTRKPSPKKSALRATAASRR
ncbi:MAG TPA: hypothetical protein VKX17_06450 [Planctomycetota bacterium]|nr:hypothetical protein [Planctomycetota bacterium]